MKATLFFVVFQVVATFAVLNLVIAIILNAFTWCYSLEPSEITGSLVLHAVHLRHFKEIWDRFDLMGTGFLDVKQLQFFLACVQYNIDAMCALGSVNQDDELMYRDYSSFGTGNNGADRDASEAMCRRNYHELIEQMTKYERSLDVHSRIQEENVNLLNGENTFIFNAEINNGVIYCAENTEEATLLKVRYTSLISILVIEPLGLTEHDVYVCHNYRNPFEYRVPGYREEDVINGCVIDPDGEDPESVALQGPEEPEEPAHIKAEDGASPSVLPSMGSPLDDKLEDMPEGYRQWYSDKRDLCQSYFDRYDLDMSGTLNSKDELKFLTINVIKACKYEVSLPEAEQKYKPACELIEKEPMTLDEFMRWFYDNIKVQVHDSHEAEFGG
jgi:hypothetical protein